MCIRDRNKTENRPNDNDSVGVEKKERSWEDVLNFLITMEKQWDKRFDEREEMMDKHFDNLNKIMDEGFNKVKNAIDKPDEKDVYKRQALTTSQNNQVVTGFI